MKDKILDMLDEYPIKIYPTETEDLAGRLADLFEAELGPDRADAARLRKLLATTNEWKIKFDKNNKIKRVSANFSSTCETSLSFRDRLRKELDEYEPIPLDSL